MARKPVTIQDIARLAQVSTATVSRTLSNPALVAADTRTAVLAAVLETGYRLNHSASNLRRQRSGNVIALVPNLANPFFAQILAGISSVLTRHGLELLIADTQAGPDAAERLAHYLGAGLADGLILFDGSLRSADLGLAVRPPIIAACEWLDAPLPSVRVDNAEGAALAVRHLAAAGHIAIGHLSGPPDNVLTRTRAAGFRIAMQAAGLPLRDEWMFAGDFTLQSGVDAGARWLAMQDRPGAIFCASDEMAVGLMSAVRDAGLSVPRDLSVVGFDDIDLCAHLTPALTTIHQPRTLIGERAADLLVGMIENRTLTCPTEVIPVDLIERASVTPPA